MIKTPDSGITRTFQFVPKKLSILFDKLHPIVQIWNIIHRRTRDEIPNRLVFKPENLSF